MKLHTICEAYDKNLAAKAADALKATYTGDNKTIPWPHIVRNMAFECDPSGKYQNWVLKQIIKDPMATYWTDDMHLARTAFASFDTIKKQYPKNLTDSGLSANINDWPDINIFITTIAEIMEKTHVPEPEEMEGVHKLAEFKTKTGFGIKNETDAHIRVFVVDNAKSLQQISYGRGWCTAEIANAEEYIKRSPQLVVYRNSTPITLAIAFDDWIDQLELEEDDIDQLMEIKNSQNGQETRPEITNLIKKIRGDNSGILGQLWNQRYGPDAWEHDI
jgi:hypothetical protein